MGSVVAYLRTSAADQNLERQKVAVGQVERTYVDQVSGKSRKNRAGLAEMLDWVRDGDVVRVSSMDRLARSVIDLAQIVEQLRRKGVSVHFVTEQLTFSPDQDNMYAEFQMHVLGAVAQLERNLIRERQREGIAEAKKRGAYRGRAKRLTPEQIAAARRQVAAGVPKAKVARDLQCGRTTLYDALAATGAYSPQSQPPMAGGDVEQELSL